MPKFSPESQIETSADSVENLWTIPPDELALELIKELALLLGVSVEDGISIKVLKRRIIEANFKQKEGFNYNHGLTIPEDKTKVGMVQLQIYQTIQKIVCKQGNLLHIRIKKYGSGNSITYLLNPDDVKKYVQYNPSAPVEEALILTATDGEEIAVGPRMTIDLFEHPAPESLTLRGLNDGSERDVPRSSKEVRLGGGARWELVNAEIGANGTPILTLSIILAFDGAGSRVTQKSSQFDLQFPMHSLEVKLGWQEGRLRILNEAGKVIAPQSLEDLAASSPALDAEAVTLAIINHLLIQDGPNLWQVFIAMLAVNPRFRTLSIETSFSYLPEGLEQTLISLDGVATVFDWLARLDTIDGQKVMIVAAELGLSLPIDPRQLIEEPLDFVKICQFLNMVGFELMTDMRLKLYQVLLTMVLNRRAGLRSTVNGTGPFTEPIRHLRSYYRWYRGIRLRILDVYVKILICHLP